VTFPTPPEKGQAVKAETIRQIIDCLRMFRPIAGPNIRVNTTPGGSIITGTPGGEQGIYETAPFAVRYHAGQWEIYLPSGCCNYGGTCAPINAAASTGGDDHASDESGWRILNLDESTGTTGEDAAGNTYREWNIEIHVKPSAKIWQVDDLNAPARRLMWACAVDRLKPAASVTDAERYANTPGDSWSSVVARVRVTEGEEGAEPARKVTQLRGIPVDVADYGETLQGFGLVWYFSLNAGALNVEAVYCVRQVAAAAGIALTGDQMTDVVNASSSVYARIDATDMTSGSGKVAVLKDPQGTSNSGPHVVWLPLYDIKQNTVTADHRAQSLANIQLFHA
jgi:hypothetical protein